VLNCKRLRNLDGLVAGLMLLLWLSTFALAASPQLHHLFHRDAPSVSHQCLITQLQQHPLWVGFALPVAPAVAPAVVTLAGCAQIQAFSHSDIRLSPSRAPPPVCSSIPVVG